jgi:hypothetical protein
LIYFYNLFKPVFTIHFITYQNQQYPLREIKLPEFGYVYISVETLSAALLHNGSSYKTKEAQYIDEQIFFFVEDDKINLPDKELRKYFAEMEL